MPKRKNRPRRSRKRQVFCAVFLAAVLALFALYQWERDGLWDRYAEDDTTPDGALLEVYFLDVGQGDSELIQIPDGEGVFNVLVDTGERQYADGLCDALTSLGVERLDALICSHPHADHMGGMARVVERFEIGAFYMPRLPDDRIPATAAYEDLLDALIAKGVTATPLAAGVEIPCPAGAKWEVFAPEPDADWDDVNNFSGVVKLTYWNVSFLFTGDAEAESEEIMLEQGYDLKADVLKVGHHGSSSSTSEDFLRAVGPEYAVISCGKDNPYGHPHEETLEKFQTGLRPRQWFRTDERGTILAKTDGFYLQFDVDLPSVQG